MPDASRSRPLTPTGFPDPDHPRHAALWSRIADAFVDRADVGHDAAHVARVYRWALRLAPEADVAPDLAGACALVHDLVDIPKDAPARALASERSALAARAPLADAGYTQAEIAEVFEAVRTCSWSRGLPPTSPLGALLQDADRLDAIGAVGVARVFACAQRMASRGLSVTLAHPDDPRAASGRPLDDARLAADHFAVKLLDLADGMHLPSAQAEAARRQATMVAFLDALFCEVEGPAAHPPPA